MFGYYLNNGETMIGVVLAKDARAMRPNSFSLRKVNEETIKELELDEDGIYELYYGC